MEKAVALNFLFGEDRAPKVIAKGKGKIAEYIIKIAKQNNIHIHSDSDLVEVLFKLEINDNIPPSLYEVMANILAFVYDANKQIAMESS